MAGSSDRNLREEINQNILVGARVEIHTLKTPKVSRWLIDFIRFAFNDEFIFPHTGLSGHPGR